MPLNRGTQKQIAQRFKGNLDYFRKAHYWRRLRLWTILLVSLAGFAAMAFFFFGGPESIYNPGPISQHHRQFGNDCRRCHGSPTHKSLAGATLKLTNEGIDQQCQKCHAGHSFHQPNVVHERACTACHLEHQGSGPMAAPGDAQCLRCHGDEQEMAASAEKGKILPPARFDYRPAAGWAVFKVPRPTNGFTAVFTSFVTGHPEFRIVADKLRETNTLKFNHRRHLVETNDIPLVNGVRLDCAFCHTPGPDGAFFQRISYEQNCRVCHSLQLDAENPGLTLPHGRAEHVRAFLRSLPTQYGELARRDRSKTAADVDEFVTRQMVRWRDEFRDGTNLEAKIFFNAHRQTPDGPMTFDGCATCHEVKANGISAPSITRPFMPDRWMVRAHFDHSKHMRLVDSKTVPLLSCGQCHGARSSSETADIVLPTINTCRECHRPKDQNSLSGAAHNCSLCHSYHPPMATRKVAEMK
jgi:hypothetical protein